MTDRDRADMDTALDDTRRPASENHGNPGHDTAEEVARGARLLRLRAARMTYDQIAQEEGYADKAAARNALMRALARHEAENARELRDLENMALDDDERVLRSIILNTSLSPSTRIKAIDSRVRLSARRSRLNGLDAPVAVQISAGVQAGLDDALSELETVVGEVIQMPVREVTTGEDTDDEAREA